ncbi:hypothetical protein AB5I41_07735 [Sphingomonas sp. MMS24-JH45]
MTEAAGEGTDTVQTARCRATRSGRTSSGSSTPAPRPSPAPATGLDNTIIGGNGNDVLDGKAGADRMEGGLGNDTYNVDVGDVIVDTGGVRRRGPLQHGDARRRAGEPGVHRHRHFTGTGNAARNAITGGAE